MQNVEIQQKRDRDLAVKKAYIDHNGDLSFIKKALDDCKLISIDSDLPYEKLAEVFLACDDVVISQGRATDFYDIDMWFESNHHLISQILARPIVSQPDASLNISSNSTDMQKLALLVLKKGLSKIRQLANDGKVNPENAASVLTQIESIADATHVLPDHIENNISDVDLWSTLSLINESN